MMSAPIVGGRPPSDDYVYKIRYLKERRSGQVRTITWYASSASEFRRKLREQGDRVTFAARFKFERELNEGS